MKKKIISAFLISTLVLPLAGCGGGGGEANNKPSQENVQPAANQAKIELRFAEDIGSNNVEYDQSQMQANYSDCIDYTGTGLYEVGQKVKIKLYANSICKVNGWTKNKGTTKISDYTDEGSLHTVNYTITPDDAGSTVYIEPHVSLNEKYVEGQKVKISFDGVSVTEYSNSYPFVTEGDTRKVKVNDVEYIYKKSEDNSQSLINGENTYIINMAGDDGVVILNNDVYKIKFADSSPQFLVKVDSGETNKVQITDTELLKTKYKLYDSNSPDKRMSFQTFIDNFKEDKEDKGLEIDPNTPLSEIDKFTGLDFNYYFYDGVVQNYKLKWSVTYEKSNKSQTKEFNPLTDSLMDLVNDGIDGTISNDFKISVDIDKRGNVTSDFHKNAIRSTLYSEAYISSTQDDSNELANINNSSAAINENRMYIKNAGYIINNSKINPKVKEEVEKFAYYGMNTDNSGLYNRIEGVESPRNKAEIEREESYYITTQKPTDVNEKIRTIKKTLYTPNDRINYSLRIQEVFDALSDSFEGKVVDAEFTYTYNEYIKDIVIDTITIGSNKYFLHYVNSTGGIYYNPKITLADGQEADDPVNNVNSLGIIRYDCDKFNITFAGLDSTNPNPKIQKLSTLFADNISNYLFSTSDKKETILKDVIDNFIYGDLTQFAILRKYEPIITVSNDGTKNITISLEDRGIPVELLQQSKYFKKMYNLSEILYLRPEYALNNKKQADKSAEESTGPFAQSTSSNSNFNDMWTYINAFINIENSLDTKYYEIVSEKKGDSKYITYKVFNHDGKGTNPIFVFTIVLDKDTTPNPANALADTPATDAEEKYVLSKIYINNVYDLDVNKNLDLFYPVKLEGDHVDFNDVKVNMNISGDGYELNMTNNNELSNTNIKSFNIIEIKGVEYIVDFDNLYLLPSANPSVGKIKINKNYLSDLKYYFEITTLENGRNVTTIYGIYNTSQSIDGTKTPELEVSQNIYTYRIEIAEDIITCKEYIALSENREYIVLKNKYYPVTTKQESKFVNIEGKDYALTDTSTSIDAKLIEFKYNGIDASFDQSKDKDIYKLYDTIITEGLDSYKESTPKVYIINYNDGSVKKVTLIKAFKNDIYYTVNYNNKEFTIKLEFIQPSEPTPAV